MSSDRRRGVVLITVLWSIALLSALAMAASTSFRGFVGVVTIERDRVRADALLTAGLEAAAGIVIGANDTPLTETDTRVSLANGEVQVRVSDEGGRIDIGRAPVELLASLFRSVGVKDADAAAQRVELWRNPGGPAPTTRKVAPGEAPSKAAVADLAFTDIRQLANVPEIPADWVAAVAPLITVYGAETVNPLTAPEAVIEALPGMDRARALTFLNMRRQYPGDFDRIAGLLGPAQQYTAAKQQQIVSVDLRARLSDGYATGARAVIVLLRQDNQPYRVLAWNPLPLARAGQP
jgi:general secretion pathway protein K